uniref:alpha-amylase n=1 Tax=Schwanniomyces occidentalis TaxID=27300 RepID=E5KJ07_SCHOC|nr:alpha-amylase [Schwanniomyces occidentalis]
MRFSTEGFTSKVVAAILAFSRLVSAQPIIFDKRDVGSSADKWKDQSIYQIVTDRFARSDGSTTADCLVSDRKYCGGSYKGIIDKLDYIQGMGFTAIWISPVVEQIPDNTAYGYAYHGYWMKNIDELNTNFGTADELKQLASELHSRSMLLMVDVVYNHYAWNGDGSSVDYSSFTPFNQQSYFHDYCLITNYNDQTNVEDCWEGDTEVSLPDLSTEDNEVIGVFQTWVSDFVQNYSIDGLRIDSAKHVDTASLTKFEDASGVYNLGEVYQGDPTYTCPYQNYMKGVTNYPLYYPVYRFFSDTSATSSELTSMISTLQSSCSDVSLLGNFIENHDQVRFPSVTSDTSLIKNAMAFIILGDGIPIIYYGQEQGLNGGSDPANREALWLSGYNTDSEYYELISKLNQIRNQAIKKDSAYSTYKSSVVSSSDHYIATRKGSDANQLISIFNNLGSNGSQDITVSNTGYSSGDKVIDIISCNSVSAGDFGSLSVSISGGMPQVYAPSSVLSGSGICNQ